MTKPKTPKPDAQPLDGSERAAPAASAPLTPAEGDNEPTTSLSASLSVGSSDPTLSAELLGQLPPSFEPSIPAEFDAQLTERERRIVWRMVAGESYAAAARNTAHTNTTRAHSVDRSDAIPPHIVAAVSACFREIAIAAGLSRGWIISNMVALFERACAAQPVLDRKGRPTGEYRFDGATAHKCLMSLADWCPELRPQRPGFAPSDVAALLDAVAARGRTGLRIGAREPRVLENAALPQQAKAS